MITSEQYDTTQRVKRMLLTKTKLVVKELLGMSEPTLNTRLKFQNWKLTEITHIKNLKP
jgi:hypothetical protein